MNTSKFAVNTRRFGVMHTNAGASGKNISQNTGFRLKVAPSWVERARRGMGGRGNPRKFMTAERADPHNHLIRAVSVIAVILDTDQWWPRRRRAR